MKKYFTAIVVDDERLSRKELISMLSGFDNIKVIGEAEDIDSAVKIIEAVKPDVIFLDIQLPKETGFDIFEKIDVQAKVIFVTAYEEYALRAFEVNALDYLLKPVNPERLKDSIERIELDNEKNRTREKKLTYEDKLFITLNTHPAFLKVSSIICIKSAGDYSEVFCTDRHGISCKSMNEWESRLPDQCFIRIHRSTIINMDSISRIDRQANDSYKIYLKNINEPVIMSRRYAYSLKNKLC